MPRTLMHKHLNVVPMADIVNGYTTIDQRELRRNGYAGIEPGTVAVFLAVCEKLSENPEVKFSVFDIGANSGLYTLLAGRLFASSVVHSFEPAPASYLQLQKICAVNNVDARLNQVGLGESSGFSKLYLSSKSDASNSLNPGFRTHCGVLDVRVSTLDSYMEGQSEGIHLLKVDTETHDPFVLWGGKKTIGEFKPFIIFELLPQTERLPASRIVDFLQDLGYCFYHIDDEGLLVSYENPVADEKEDLRDWLVSPFKISEEFQMSVLRWRDEIRNCTPDSNRFVLSGNRKEFIVRAYRALKRRLFGKK